MKYANKQLSIAVTIVTPLLMLYRLLELMYRWWPCKLLHNHIYIFTSHGMHSFINNFCPAELVINKWMVQKQRNIIFIVRMSPMRNIEYKQSLCSKEAGLLGHLLLSTWELVIVEEMRDRVWGTGLRLYNPGCLNPSI